MIDKTQDLRPCPFCGEEAEITKSTQGIYAECTNCTGKKGPCPAEDAAIKAWNRRPSPASPAPQGPAGEYCLYTPTGWEQYPRKEWATACGLKVVHNTEAWDGVTNVPVSHGPSCMKCKRKPVDAAPAPRADTREAARLWEPVQGSEAIAPALAPVASPLVPAPLVWTKEKPTRAGWYWYRNMGERNIGDVYMAVWGFVAHLSGSGHPVAVKGLDGEWAGPIPPPLDPKGPGEPKGEPEPTSYLDQIGAKSIQLEVNRLESAKTEKLRAQEGGKA